MKGSATARTSMAVMTRESTPMCRKGFLEREAVHHGGEHAHVVGGGLVDVGGLGELAPADEVSAADDDGELDVGLVCVFDFLGDEAVLRNQRPWSRACRRPRRRV